MTQKPSKLMTEYLYQTQLVFENGPFFEQTWSLFKSAPTKNSLKEALIWICQSNSFATDVCIANTNLEVEYASQVQL